MHFSTSGKYSFKVKPPSFILFTSKPISMTHSRLKRCQHLLQGEEKESLLFFLKQFQKTIAGNPWPNPLSPFMLPVHYSIVAREGVCESRIKQGKAKNPTTMRSSRTAKGKAPKTVTIVCGFFFKKKAEDTSEKIVLRHIFYNAFFSTELFFSYNTVFVQF